MDLTDWRFSQLEDGLLQIDCMIVEVTFGDDYGFISVESCIELLGFGSLLLGSWLQRELVVGVNRIVL